jgi:hypothetical protein
MIYKPVYSFKFYKNSDNTPVVVLPKYIANVSFAETNEFQKQTELMTGVSDPNGAVIEIIKPKTGQDTALEEFLGRSFDWRMTRLDIYMSNDGNVNNLKMMYSGLLFVRKETDTKVIFTTRNFLDLLNITLIETPLLRNRKTATKILDTVSVANLKKQDPTLKEGSAVGIINTLFWLAGGRPYKYKSLYTTQDAYVAGQYPKFYFDCENSIINPEWLWFNYENLLQDLRQLCKATGGLITQDNDGVVRYKNVFSMRETWNGVTLTDSSYSSLDLSESGTEPYAKIITTFTPRYLSNSQEVYTAVLGEYLNPGQSLSRQIEFNKPTYKIMNKSTSGQLTDSIVGGTLTNVKEKISAVDIFGTRRKVNARIGNYTKMYIPRYVSTSTPGTYTIVEDTKVVSSQSATFYLSHNVEEGAGTLYIGEVFIYGRSLEAASQETYIKQLNQFPTISGYKELRLPDNPYVQSESQGKRIIEMAKYLMVNPRLEVSAKEVAVVSGIELGKTIRLTSNVYNIDEYFSITGIEYGNNLAKADLTLLSLSGLYMLDDLFTIGTTYTTNPTKRLSF